MSVSRSQLLNDAERLVLWREALDLVGPVVRHISGSPLTILIDVRCPLREVMRIPDHGSEIAGVRATEIGVRLIVLGSGDVGDLTRAMRLYGDRPLYDDDDRSRPRGRPEPPIRYRNVFGIDAVCDERVRDGVQPRRRCRAAQCDMQ